MNVIYKLFKTIKMDLLIVKIRARKLGIEYKKGIKIGKNIRIHDGTKIVMDEFSILGPNIDFWGGGTVYIGKYSSIGRYSWIYSSKKAGVKIGDNVLCAAFVYITDTNHNFSDYNKPIRKQGTNSREIVISDDVWIGAKVTILQGTIISRHSVVGACSLLNRQYPENSLIAGVPAKKIKNI